MIVVITITRCSSCLAPPDWSRCRTNKQADDNDDDEVKEGRIIAALIMGSAAERREISACALLIIQTHWARIARWKCYDVPKGNKKKEENLPS